MEHRIPTPTPQPARPVRFFGLVALLGASLTLGGCARQMVSSETSLPGAAVPSAGSMPADVGAANGRAAIDAILKAVNTQDLQRMSAYWGNSKGLARDQLKRDNVTLADDQKQMRELTFALTDQVALAQALDAAVVEALATMGPDESALHIADTVDRLVIDDTGTFRRWDGTVHPW